MALALVAATLVFHEPNSVTSQQGAPCANSQTAGKTDKQAKLDDCGCEQATATDKPTYRVGASPFGRKVVTRRAGPRVGQAAGGRAKRTRETTEPDLYGGIEMPNLKDLQSPEVVGLKDQLSRAREAAKTRVERVWQRDYRRSF